MFCTGSDDKQIMYNYVLNIRSIVFWCLTQSVWNHKTISRYTMLLMNEWTKYVSLTLNESNTEPECVELMIQLLRVIFCKLKMF